MNLRSLLAAVTSGDPPHSSIDEFVHFCRKTALVLLRRKLHAGRLSIDHIGLPIDDLALDCVADLFSRDPEGRFVQLQVYMRGIEPDRLSEEELMSHMRRLIFAKVNQGMFRIYHEIDPSLSRIIRNIKISVHALENYVIVDRFGEPFLRPAACDPMEELPPVDPVVLKAELAKVVGTSETVPSLLAHLLRHLRDLHGHCRMISLVQAALIFRSLFSVGHEGQTPGRQVDEDIVVSDTCRVIREVCRRIRERSYAKYVKSGKVDEATYGKYFRVIEAAVTQMILDRNGGDVAYFRELKKLIPEMGEEEYRTGHRGKIEYLGRLAYRRAVRELKDEL